MRTFLLAGASLLASPAFAQTGAPRSRTAGQGHHRHCRRTAERAVREGKITATERTTIMNAFAASMRGYTYYER